MTTQGTVAIVGLCLLFASVIALLDLPRWLVTGVGIYGFGLFVGIVISFAAKEKRKDRNG